MTQSRGRPFRFLLGVLGGWTVLRVAMLLPEAEWLPERMATTTRPLILASLPPLLRGMWPDTWAGVTPAPRVATASHDPHERMTKPASRREIIALLGRIGFGEEQRRPRAGVLVAPYAPPPPPTAITAPTAPPRLSGSGWLALRGGGGESLGPGGQLGGSQGGIRLRYALGAARRFALSARVSTPLRGKGAEAALGVEWRPANVPITMIAEHRLGLDGAPGGPALMAVGGLNPTEIGAGFSIEGYGQAGAVLRGDGLAPFADGAARVARPLTRDGALTLGVGAWGGAQRDSQRLDIGPSIALAVPLGSRAARLSLDWRQRIAGEARPGSGPALTLGTDF